MLLNEAHEYQLLNYLKATGLQVGLLLNFGGIPQVKRMVNTKRDEQRPSAQSALSASSPSTQKEENL